MGKLTLALALVAGMVAVTHAQYATVVLNYEKSYFGENEPLPADKDFIINGAIPLDVYYVEIEIFDSKDKKACRPLYSNFWKRNFDNNSPVFNLPVNYQLKDGKDYHLLLRFYRSITERERARLTQDLYATLDAYVDQSFNFSNKKLKLLRNNRQIISDLNSIMDRGLSLYRSKTLASFPGFSDMVKLKLKQIEGVKLKKAENVESTQDGMRRQLINELKTILHNEATPYLNAEIYALLDDKFIEEYPTEKKHNNFYLSPHFGYGGVALNTDAEDFSYATKMYAGMSFPLARNSKSAFLNNTALSVGAFIGNFEDGDGNTLSGPLFKVPTYASLSYRPFAFFRIQAGAAFLEDIGGNAPGFDKKVEVRPFVGVSAELNVWFNSKKK